MIVSWEKIFKFVDQALANVCPDCYEKDIWLGSLNNDSPYVDVDVICRSHNALPQGGLYRVPLIKKEIET